MKNILHIGAFIVVGMITGMAQAQGNADPLECLYSARVVHWAYAADITREQAEEKAKSFAAHGVNMILTEDHRYIMYDLAEGAASPKFLFKVQNREASLRATKLITDVCHKHGIKVLHHVTCCYCTEDYMRAHRDWTQRDARNPAEPLFFEEYGGVWLLCLNNPEFREAYFKTVIDITKRTGVDGWMIDEVEWLPTWFSCGCRWCREKFTRETGYVLPIVAKRISRPLGTQTDSPIWENFEDAVWRAWIRFRMKASADFFVDLKRLMDKETPGQILTACHAGASDTWLAQWWGMDIIEFARGLNFIFYEAYVRKGIPFYSWRRYLAEMKLYSAVARWGAHPPLTLFYPNSDKELEFCWAMCGVAGHRFWAAGSSLHPLQESAIDFFAWQHDHEFLFGKQEPIANIALLYSKQTRDGYKGRDTAFYVDEWAGWAETLIEANIPYVVILDKDLNAEYLKRFRLLILPNAVCLSDAQLRVINDFIVAGGKVIATAETAQRDETGAPRANAQAAAALREKSRYFADKIGLKHVLNYARRDTVFEDKRDTATRELMLKAVRDPAGDDLPLKINAPTGVVVSAFRQENGNIVIHLLNCTGAAIPSGTALKDKDYPVEFPAVRNITVRVGAAPETPLSRATLHSIGEQKPLALEMRRSAGAYEVAIPELTTYAIVILTRSD